MMDIRIYQINSDRDKNRVSFMEYEALPKFQGAQEPNPEIYDRIYEGSVDCSTLEGVYEKFNLDHPAEFRGHSLSVSDIVEVVKAESVKPGFYFCDSFGFKKIPFEPVKTQETSKTIKVVLLEPGKLARVADIDSSLRGMQRVVGGDIEGYYPFEEQVCIVCNDEGKINGLPLNRAIREEDTVTEMTYGELTDAFEAAERDGTGRHMTGYIVFTKDSFDKPYPEEARTYVVSSNNKAFQPNMGGYSIYASCLDGSDPMVRLEAYMAAEHGGKDGWKVERCYTKEPGKEIIEIIAGTCFICDCRGESFGSLSDEQLKRYSKQFKYPEQFIRINGEICAVPFKPNEKSHER
ncbi:MAG: DUF3846 domain-containing protein [Lachnospiraceae bacterium]|jgi:hypothetical protein